jgi:hypothetical protein
MMLTSFAVMMTTDALTKSSWNLLEATSDQLLVLDEIGMTNCSMKEALQQYYFALLQNTASRLSH